MSVRADPCPATRILIVDDSPDERLLIHHLLNDAGHMELLTATGAARLLNGLDRFFQRRRGAGKREIDSRWLLALPCKVAAAPIGQEASTPSEFGRKTRVGV